MQPDAPATARVDALAELAAEAARFASRPSAEPQAVAGAPRRPRTRGAARPRRTPAPVATHAAQTAAEGLPGYVPNAVAPERGNTRPAVPVDGRLHLRAAPAAVAALDEAVAGLRRTDPAALRDLERATLVRIGIGLVLADVRAHGARGVVGEAVRAALDPAQRHLDVPMPDPARWLRTDPTPPGAQRGSSSGPRTSSAGEG